MSKLRLLILCACLPMGLMAQDGGQSMHKYQANWESLSAYETPDWFRDAKFGIFIHWGVYSVPGFGSEWYPRNMYDSTTPEYKHHVATYGPQSAFGYKDFIRFTTKGAVLYAITLGKPVEKTFIENLGLKDDAGTVAGVELVGSGEKVKWSQKADALVIEPSAAYPSEDAVVYKIRFGKS